MLATSITLKDAADADVVFTLQTIRGNTSSYVAKGANMTVNRRLDLTINERQNTVRVLGKLSVPTAGSCDAGCSTQSFTEVGSFDLSSVKVADQGSQDDFLALFSSFVESQAVTDAYTTGV